MAAGNQYDDNERMPVRYLMALAGDSWTPANDGSQGRANEAVILIRTVGFLWAIPLA